VPSDSTSARAAEVPENQYWNLNNFRRETFCGRFYESSSTQLHLVRPRTHFKKGQLKPEAPRHVLKTPDADNLAKFVLDALQKKIVSDDKLVTTLVVHKRWCSTENEQRTVIELRVFNQ
jgi:hypothetical protein